MASSIDPTKPGDGVPAVKADLRDNLQVAKDEIEVLQSTKLEDGQPFDMQHALLIHPVLEGYAEVSPMVTVSGGVLTLDLESGSIFEVVLDQDVTTLVLQNPPPSGRAGALTLILRQDGIGGHTFSWPPAVKWAAGQVPVAVAAGDGIDVYALLTRDGGLTWFGFPAGQDFS